MNPIINPLWFYIISTAGNLSSLFLWVGATIVVIFGAVCFFSIGAVLDKDLEESIAKSIIFKGRKFLIFGVLLLCIYCFVPSKTTCYQMMAASVVTEENIEKAGHAATDVINYIVESVDQLINDDKEGE